jgi:diguanylate cyclase (GGDEF)-like protein
MNAIASTLRPLVPFSTCALFLRDAANGIVRCRFASGIGDAAFQGLLFGDGAGIVGRAIAARACVTGGPPPPGTTDPGMPVGELHSALATPLIVDDVAVGTLVLYQATPDYFNDDHRRLATRVSDQIAAVIGNSLVFERTQEESVTDALTGLPNTRFLFPHLTREIARASRLNSPMAVLLVDLDRLKHINDNFSHPIGDRALRAVAAVLRGAIRPYDVCVRYGGDEFIVLLSDCGPEQAEAKRVELKRAVEALPFSAGEGLPVKLSISAGAAVFPGDGETYDALLQEADSRMYKDKAAGHGRGGA